MKKLPWSWIVTFMWVGIVIAVPFFCSGIEKPSKLNEWGDYLAGAFSPLAFFWLIMGYLQQGKELQQNTKALELQAQELQNSVTEQRKQNEAYEKELIARRIQSKPILNIKNASYRYEIRYDEYGNEYFEGTEFSLEIVNYGQLAIDIKILINNTTEQEYYKLESNDSLGIGFQYSYNVEKYIFDSSVKELCLDLKLEYCDSSGYPYCSKFQLTTNDFVDGAVGIDYRLEVKALN